MLRRFGEHIERTVLGGVGRATSQLHERTPLSVDLLESEESYLAEFDAPGVAAEDIDIRLVGTELQVKLHRTRDLDESIDLLLRGRALRRSGSVTLPSASVDAGAASATLTSSGTLRIRVPKTEPKSTEEPIRIKTDSEDDSEDADDDQSSPAAG
ncbi:Hsp20/alpha crystallin family protein [Halocatena pleomorpha]|uniref:Hsp20/alpha crystallin family protein n=1 Tax=Halocatena pleomorpha TaxID=1785090 RepID=A0A3P3RBN2_9EURY|nr:Hsp20/alpha crystallin family protein [Halocatena pleomorpha]RRJ30887.1 Hsp20/alpha crystallin family protein [Halocatena pleomorpha]